MSKRKTDPDIVCALLIERPRTTKELTKIFHCSAPAVSRIITDLRGLKRVNIVQWVPGSGDPLSGRWCPVWGYGSAPDAPEPRGKDRKGRVHYSEREQYDNMQPAPRATVIQHDATLGPWSGLVKVELNEQQEN